ncbi:MAG: cation diffusion facilitator family transporter [Patescibacteria group bacterium]|nr:cation diffusion facilitator family transporter [Patescibacteria group bacterium]
MSKILKIGQRATITAGLATIFFALAKGIVGLLSGSLVLVADAIHSAADSISTFVAWLGLRVASKKPSDKFQYGYFKAESIASFLISILILFAGFVILKESINKIFTEYELNIPFIAISVAFLDGMVMFFVGTYEMKVGEKINSQSLIADGKESRIHLLSSSVVLIGLFSSWLKIPYLEGAAGILISLFIFQTAFIFARDSIFALMDVSPNKEVDKKIRKILEKISEIRGFENLKLRKAGPFILGEVKVKIGKSANAKKISEVSLAIENEVKKKIKAIDSFLVSVSVDKPKKQKICIPLEKNNGIDSKISNHFSRAENFIFINIDKGRIIDFYIKENLFKDKKERTGLMVCEFIIKEKINSVIGKEMGPITLNAFEKNIIDVYIVDKEETVKQAVEKFLTNRIKLLKEPTKTRI